MKKGSGSKERISITLDKGLVKEINSNCEERLMKVSNYIEKLIRIGLKNERNK
ncbi:hypothetical protein KY366_02000 [Candidatus Woesearchaeota archaeon]|nr:hypothetical protein [Candidatus Woesearchaeota archaeon]